MINIHKPVKNSLVYFFIIWLLLFCVIVFSPNKFIYDEILFAANLRLYDQIGHIKLFLVQMKEQSPGPLYQIFHHQFRQLSRYDPVLMRILNFVSYSATSYILFIFLRSLKSENYLIKAFVLTGIPLTWIIGGMALTEMPAIFFVTLSFAILFKSLNVESNYYLATLYSLIAGLLLGLAILGRTQYLMILPAAFLLFTIQKNKILIFLFIFSAAVLPLCMFDIWKGIVPPYQQKIYNEFKIEHGILAIGYLSIMHLLLFDNFITRDKKHILPIVFISVVLGFLNFYFRLIEFEPVRGLVSGFGYPILTSLYKHLFFCFIVFLTLFYLFSFLSEFVNKFDDKWFLFIHSCIFLIILPSVATSNQFSSRYVSLILPLMVIAYHEKIKFDRLFLIKSIIGTSLGFLSLFRYYEYF